MLRDLRGRIGHHIKENPLLYLAIIFTIITGITSGSFTVGNLDDSQRLALDSYLRHSILDETALFLNKSKVFFHSIWLNIQFITLIFLSGLFTVTIPIIFIVIGIKSFYIGFTISFIISNFEFAGFLFFLFCLMPQTLIYLFSYTGIGIVALESSIKKIKTRRLNYTKEQRQQTLLAYLLNILLFLTGAVFAAALESFLMPLLIGMFRWVFK